MENKFKVGDTVMCTRNEYTYRDENNWCIWKEFSYVVDGVSYISGEQEIRLRGVGNSNYSPMYPSRLFNIVNTVTKKEEMKNQIKRMALKESAYEFKTQRVIEQKYNDAGALRAIERILQFEESDLSEDTLDQLEHVLYAIFKNGLK